MVGSSFSRHRGPLEITKCSPGPKSFYGRRTRSLHRVFPYVSDSSAPSSPIPVVKPGICPVVNTLVACSLPYPPGDCSTDGDCSDMQKCCDVGCVYHCADV
uniref:WAP domain-containing protein n=1 Tax=Leptobrachium leishanense TaxID=445787 RepID=A0A8C5M9W4_9ANUR